MTNKRTISAAMAIKKVATAQQVAPAQLDVAANLRLLLKEAGWVQLTPSGPFCGEDGGVVAKSTARVTRVFMDARGAV